MDKIRAIVVDDHTILRDGIRTLIDLYDDIEIVGEASEGKEAIALTQKLRPDVVIMDLALPGMDGMEATRCIKKQFPQVKVLVLTQYDDREYVLSAVKAGASGYVPKKALGADLVAAVRSVHKSHFFLYPSATTALIEDYLRHAKTEPFDNLTKRQRDVLKMIADGHTSQEMAIKLCISVKAVSSHRARMMNKLGIHNRAELIIFAAHKGLVNLDT